MTRCHFGLLMARASLRTTSANPEALDHPYAPAFGPQPRLVHDGDCRTTPRDRVFTSRCDSVVVMC